MIVIDSQVHIWGRETPERPWAPGRSNAAQQPHPVSKDMMLEAMLAAGVDRAIIVPPSWEGDRNDLALEARRLHPDRFAIMGRVPITDPDSRALLAGWKNQPGMLGLRFTFHLEAQRAWLTDGTADWIWPAAAAAGLPVMVYAPDSLPALHRIAERYPELKLIVDHVGLNVERRGPAAFEAFETACALSKFPNVAIKASGMAGFSLEAYPFRDVHPYIRRLYDAFGPRRVLWGTDITRMRCSYRECVRLFTEEQPWLAGDDLDWVMGRAVCAWTGWSYNN